LAVSVFLYTGLVGLLVAKRRLRILAGFMMTFSCLALVAAVAIPAILRANTKVTWRDFQPPHGQFTIKMPTTPTAREVRNEVPGGYTIRRYLYESIIPGQGTAQYVVVDYSPALAVADTDSYERLLQLELNAMAARTSSTVLSKRTVNINGCTGIEFEMKPPANLALKSPRTFGRLFMNAEHLYMMHLTASDSSELLASKEMFFGPGTF
jgi:hypothetical protein